MIKLTTLAAAAVMLAVGAPAFAQMQSGNTSSSMMSGDKKMKMSDADMKKWESCQAMSQDMMMKDKKCMSMKKKNDMMMKK